MEPKQCKFLIPVVTSMLFVVQMLSLSISWTDISISEEITLQVQLFLKYHSNFGEKNSCIPLGLNKKVK